MANLTISFPTQKSLEAFAHWLDGQGEQDYWNWMEEQDPMEGETVSFQYASPLDLTYPQNDKRRYTNAKFLNGNTITTRLYGTPLTNPPDTPTAQ